MSSTYQSPLECVANVAEGRSEAVLRALAEAAGPALLDLHRDPDHHRSVLTLAGPMLDQSVRALARRTVELVDITDHRGAHPRLGALDVVPFAPVVGHDLTEAAAARDSFARWAAAELRLPCFVYGPPGPGPSLPEIRRGAFKTLVPDFGPPVPHPTAGSVCVGARPVLVAYNLWLDSPDITLARQIARSIRRPGLRVLALRLGGQVQVSCNLLEPDRLGPAQAYDAVAAQASVARAELVGLIPASALASVPPTRWDQLGLSDDRTIEARLASRAV